ncbi:competence-damaged domain-containing protein [Trichoderma aethiopicum]
MRLMLYNHRLVAAITQRTCRTAYPRFFSSSHIRHQSSKPEAIMDSDFQPEPRIGETAFHTATDLVEKLRKAGQTVGVAESLTAGAVCSTIASAMGASNVFRGGCVAYGSELKEELLGVDKELIAKEGVIHADVAKQMAEGARRITSLKDGNTTTWGVGTTGVAGPEKQDDKPVGTVYIGIAGPKGTVSYGYKFEGTREQIIEATAVEALHRLRKLL